MEHVKYVDSPWGTSEILKDERGFWWLLPEGGLHRGPFGPYASVHETEMKWLDEEETEK